MGVDGYNFPGGFPKQVALKALRNVIETQLEGPHLKMIMDIQATEKNDLGFWSKTISCELAECIWDLLDEFYIVVHGQPSSSSPCKPSQLAEKDEDEDMEEDDGLVQYTKEEQQAKQAKINLHRRAVMAKAEILKEQNTHAIQIFQEIPVCEQIPWR